MSCALLSVSEHRIRVDTTKCPFVLPDGRGLQGVFRVDFGADKENVDIHATFDGRITPPTENKKNFEKCKVEEGAILLAVDDKGIRIDTSLCPLVLNDGRAFMGVFRARCPGRDQVRADLRATFQGTTFVSETNNQQKSGKIEEIREHQGARREKAPRHARDMMPGTSCREARDNVKDAGSAAPQQPPHVQGKPHHRRHSLESETNPTDPSSRERPSGTQPRNGQDESRNGDHESRVPHRSRGHRGAAGSHHDVNRRRSSCSDASHHQEPRDPWASWSHAPRRQHAAAAAAAAQTRSRAPGGAAAASESTMPPTASAHGDHKLGPTGAAAGSRGVEQATRSHDSAGGVNLTWNQLEGLSHGESESDRPQAQAIGPSGTSSIPGPAGTGQGSRQRHGDSDGPGHGPGAAASGQAAAASAIDTAAIYRAFMDRNGGQADSDQHAAAGGGGVDHAGTGGSAYPSLSRAPSLSRSRTRRAAAAGGASAAPGAAAAAAVGSGMAPTRSQSSSHGDSDAAADAPNDLLFRRAASSTALPVPSQAPSRSRTSTDSDVRRAQSTDRPRPGNLKPGVPAASLAARLAADGAGPGLSARNGGWVPLPTESLPRRAATHWQSDSDRLGFTGNREPSLRAGAAAGPAALEGVTPDSDCGSPAYDGPPSSWPAGGPSGGRPGAGCGLGMLLRRASHMAGQALLRQFPAGGHGRRGRV